MLRWDLFVLLILPFMLAEDNEKSEQITSIQEMRCSQFLKTKKSFENKPPVADIREGNQGTTLVTVKSFIHIRGSSLPYTTDTV